ncbi:MAG: hypothetical protein H7Y00_05615 [Fimbriimonadaceae bacterium]|nr:hypothetical protein [Chitinophagales bacterium]
MKQPLLLLLLPSTLLFLFSCNKEKDYTRHLVIEKVALSEGNNMIFEDTYMEVYAHLEEGQITYTAKSLKDDEVEMSFTDGALKIKTEGGVTTLEGDVFCSCTKLEDEVCTGKWECSDIAPAVIAK